MINNVKSKIDFVDLVIAFGAGAEIGEIEDSKKSVIAQAWYALDRAERNFGCTSSDDYCPEAYEAAGSFFDDFKYWV